MSSVLHFQQIWTLTLKGIINGGGSLNEAELTLAQLSHVLKVLSCSSIPHEHSTYSMWQNVYVCEILFGCTITIVKFSVLCFYRTIFSVQHFRRTTLAVGIVCLVWFVITEIILIFQCNPIGAMWRFEDWKCMPFGAILFGYELTNLLLDICILCLPIQEIRKLQLPARQKVILSGIFLLGGL